MMIGGMAMAETNLKDDSLIQYFDEEIARHRKLSPEEKIQDSIKFFMELGAMDANGNWIGPYAVLGK